MSNYHLINELIVKVGNSQPPESKAEAYFLKLGGHAFQEMKKYLTEIESDLRIRRLQKRRYYKDQERDNPEWRQLINEISERDFKELGIQLTHILYGSCLVASFTIFETMFKKVCDFAAHKYSQKIPPNLTTGTIIDCKSFIASTLRIDMSDIKDHWKKLVKYRDIRNDIVHHNGIITKDTETILKFLKGLEHVQVRKVRKKDQYVFTILERGFIFDFLNCAAQFLGKILGKLPRGKRKTLPHLMHTKSKS